MVFVFTATQLVTLVVLCWRNWWAAAPAFMAFWWLSCLQAIVGLADRPHNELWWRQTWAPVELVVMLAAVAASWEVLILRTRYLDNVERFSVRFFVPMASGGIVGLNWTFQAASFYGWVVYARELIWIGAVIALGLVIVWFECRPVSEPGGLRNHCFITAALMTAHAAIAPLARTGWGKDRPQMVYQGIVLVCCTAWLLFCSPAVSRQTHRDQQASEAEAASPSLSDRRA